MFAQLVKLPESSRAAWPGFTGGVGTKFGLFARNDVIGGPSWKGQRLRGEALHVEVHIHALGHLHSLRTPTSHVQASWSGAQTTMIQEAAVAGLRELRKRTTAHHAGSRAIMSALAPSWGGQPSPANRACAASSADQVAASRQTSIRPGRWRKATPWRSETVQEDGFRCDAQNQPDDVRRRG